MAWLLVAAATLLPTSVARAEDRLSAGTKSVGLGGTVSLSHGTRHDYNTVTGLELLPHVGYVVSDAMGPGWLRGNLELLLEPTLIHLGTEGARRPWSESRRSAAGSSQADAFGRTWTRVWGVLVGEPLSIRPTAR